MAAAKAGGADKALLFEVSEAERHLNQSQDIISFPLPG